MEFGIRGACQDAFIPCTTARDDRVGYRFVLRAPLVVGHRLEDRALDGRQPPGSSTDACWPAPVVEVLQDERCMLVPCSPRLTALRTINGSACWRARRGLSGRHSCGKAPRPARMHPSLPGGGADEGFGGDESLRRDVSGRSTLFRSAFRRSRYGACHDPYPRCLRHPWPLRVYQGDTLSGRVRHQGCCAPPHQRQAGYREPARGSSLPSGCSSLSDSRTRRRAWSVPGRCSMSRCG